METRNNVCHFRNANNNDQIIRKVPAYRCPQEEAECAKTTESGTQHLPAGGARRADSSLRRAAWPDLSERVHQQMKTYQKARVHISQVSTALRKQRSQMERGWSRCIAKRVHGQKNGPAPSAQEKSSMEWGGNKSHQQRQVVYSDAAIWRSANTAAALRSGKVIKMRNGSIQPTAC